MKFTVTHWSISRKTIRPSFSLGALGMLFSVSDRITGPRLSEQDRLDTAYPYRLELTSTSAARGRYRLISAEPGADAWVSAVNNRVWQVENRRSGPTLVTDLTEYERLSWEELVAGGVPMLLFEPLA